MRLVLASASPRRAELLRAAGFTFEILPVEVDESVRRGESADAYVRRVAMEKSARALEMIEADHDPPNSGRALRDEAVVIAADTAVVVGDQILGKPDDVAAAEWMLRCLSGRRHEVMTGVSVRRADLELGCVETTIVECAALSDADVAWYLATEEGRDKAGAYAIQGLASRFIGRIEGSYSNVVGLPVHAVCELLRDLR